MSSINFQIYALNNNNFTYLFSLPDTELRKLNAKKITVDEYPGYPCRVSLEDAKIGEAIIALPYIHHEVNSPYRSSGPIFIRDKCLPASLATNEIPAVLNNRLLSLRAYNKQSMMIDVLITDGKDVKKMIINLLANNKIEYIHIHNANPGCYSCRVERVFN